MKNKFPVCIAENMMWTLKHPNIETVVENAKELVEQEFTYEAAVERWKEILQSDIHIMFSYEVISCSQRSI